MVQKCHHRDATVVAARVLQLFPLDSPVEEREAARKMTSEVTSLLPSCSHLDLLEGLHGVGVRVAQAHWMLRFPPTTAVRRVPLSRLLLALQDRLEVARTAVAFLVNHLGERKTG